MYRRILQHINSVLNTVFNVISVATTLSLVALVFFMVLSRYVFNWNIFGLDELAALSAMWLYMFGAIVSSKNSTHIVVDFAPLVLSKHPRLLKAYGRFISLITVASALFFIYLSWQLLKFSLKHPQYTAALNLRCFSR